MYSDIALKAASEEANLGLMNHMANLTYITHNFSPAVGTKYGAVALPTIALSAGEFDAEDNNFCDAEEVDGAVVTLSKRYKSAVTLTDVQAGETDINILRDGTKAITRALTDAVQKYVFGGITTDLSASFSGSTKTAFADLFKVATDNGLDPYRCTLVLNPEYFAKLLGLMDASIYGGSQAVQQGVIPQIFGFRAVEVSPYLSEGVKGYIIDESSYAVVARLDKPAVDGYVDTFVGQTDDGFPVQFRVFEHLCQGRMILAGSVLVGTSVLNENGIIKLV